MCGIIGLISNSEVSGDLYTGLLSLQHRGQDAAGIVTYDDGLRVVKEAGFIANIFTREDLVKLSGKIGIGHTRYPTVGSVLKQDSQPFFTERPTTIAIAQNGNVVNYGQIKEELVNSKEALDSNSDGEMILKLIAKELSKEKNYEANSFFNAVQRTMEKLNGSYSIIGMTSKGLFAFRDPCAIKPLVMGESAAGYGFSSETVALDVLGYKIIRDLEPGEMVFISKNLEMKSRILKQKKRAHCMFEWVYFARADSVLEKVGVYESRIALGKALAEEWKKSGIRADIVVPVPDTARPAALSFAEELGLRYTEGFIKNRYIHRTFIMPSQLVRETAMKLKLNPIIKEVKGRRIVLIDDSLVRGTTLKKNISMLRAAGATEVHVLLTCPPIKWPCFYGIDMSTRKELAAATKSVEEIRKSIGADSLIYQTIDNLKKSIGVPMCMACLDGDYPTEVPKEAGEAFEKQRENERQFNWNAL
jgi:amidophosphoribosyltransferase